MNVFEFVIRNKSRFNTHQGQITPEQVMDLPLIATHPQHVDLDKVAKQVDRELQQIGTSFVSDKPNPQRELLEMNLEFVKTVIEQKKAERAEAEERAKDAAEIASLKEALHSIEQDEIKSLDKKTVKARLSKLQKKSEA